jgi:hypothetical protein
MRKRLIVAVLITFLSVAPAYAGHSLAGGDRYCDCTPVNGACACCGTIFNSYTPESIQDNEASEHGAAPIDEDGKLGNLLESFFMWLELKA